MTEEAANNYNDVLRLISESVIRVRGGDDDGKTVHFGTGFFYRRIAQEGEFGAIVSNKHVLCGKRWLEFDFALSGENKRRAYGKAKTIRFMWDELPVIEHPDPTVDLAAADLAAVRGILERRAPDHYNLRFLAKENLPHPYIESALLPGSTALMIGFPNGLMDEVNNLPVTRRGSLATPYDANYQGETNFVVDIASFGGSSGSPVFALFENTFPGNDGKLKLGMGPQVYFIGVLHSGPTLTASGTIKPAPVPTSSFIVQTSVMMHLGYCLKAFRVEELMQVPGFNPTQG